MINPLSSISKFPYGCASRRWSPSLSYYLSSARKGFYLFDASKTAFLFRRAALLLSELRRRRAPLLLLIPLHSPILSVAGATSPVSGSFGLLSNWFNNRFVRRRLPSCLLLLDSSRSSVAIEGFRLGLPTVGVVSGDWDGSCFTHPIPLSGFSFSLLREFLPPVGQRLVRAKRRHSMRSRKHKNLPFRRRRR